MVRNIFCRVSYSRVELITDNVTHNLHIFIKLVEIFEEILEHKKITVLEPLGNKLQQINAFETKNIF